MSEEQRVWIDEADKMPERADITDGVVTVTPKPLTVEEISNARIGKLVIDIDTLCDISKASVNEALTGFAVIAAIRLSQLQRPAQVKFEKFFEKECKRQRKLQLEQGSVRIQETRDEVATEAEGVTQEQISNG